MKEKLITMQNGSDEVNCSSTTLHGEEMTFSKSQRFLSSDAQPEALKDNLSDCDNSTKFEGINLEDDIEKVEVILRESSESEAEQVAENAGNDNFPSIFPGIPEQNPADSIKNWLQKITEMQNGLQKKKIANSVSTATTSSSGHTPNRVVKYQDLPYMGEITLDNSKPRRGRKPKKADICHLIYKNYGTIFPGTPNPASYLSNDKKQSLDLKDNDILSRNDVQNRIISSLLEKRLTQEHKRTKNQCETKSLGQNEPLNLCIRDLNHLKIRLQNKYDTVATDAIKSEPHSDDEIELVNDNASPTISIRNESCLPASTPDSFTTSSPDTPQTPESQTAPGGYVYWPNAGVFIHPVALQQQLMMYQKLSANNAYTLPRQSPKPPPEKNETSELRKLIPKHAGTRKSQSEETEPAPHEAKPKRHASSSHEKCPAKRKRSAIFIPPIPTENNTNPATEVSICKFKFTGGAKPSLQEKKMLSVDSGGNFRYYSGTGDKSMRGYEFFPRETLQQQVHNSQGSSTGAFLQASGEKIYPAPPVEITGGKTSSDFLLTPEIPTSSLVTIQDAAKNRKRKSRKSVQREKLEQTFKEKGFLIQTQQLESAEGATYCKFRQLRKFTRYLFRSWKDYLPGNVGELPENEKNEVGEDFIRKVSEMSNSIPVNVNSDQIVTTLAE